MKTDDGSRRHAGVVVAVTGDDDRFAHARQHAMTVVGDSGRVLLLYDIDAPTFLGDPLPTWWSGEGSEGQFSRRLDQVNLRATGRATIADQVAEAEALGIAAFGWLPSRHGEGPLSEYAKEQGATTIVVPAGMPDIEGLRADFEVIEIAEPVLEPRV
jgi:hypothetical protein